ncbi:MAG: GrpB family protein [Elusimicrobia bacterium]|nr:GrpB family protein [Elusimicrobiota bacterium]
MEGTAPKAWKRSLEAEASHESLVGLGRGQPPRQFTGRSSSRGLARDNLIRHPEVATEYEKLKLRLSKASPNDRAAYTTGKTGFVMETTRRAKQACRVHTS